MAFLTDTFTAPISVGEKFAATWAHMVEARAKRSVYKQTLLELGSLSTRELSDLGIHRSSIRRIAYETAYAN